MSMEESMRRILLGPELRAVQQEMEKHWYPISDPPTPETAPHGVWVHVGGGRVERHDVSFRWNVTPIRPVAGEARCPSPPLWQPVRGPRPMADWVFLAIRPLFGYRRHRICEEPTLMREGMVN